MTSITTINATFFCTYDLYSFEQWFFYCFLMWSDEIDEHAEDIYSCIVNMISNYVRLFILALGCLFLRSIWRIKALCHKQLRCFLEHAKWEG